MLDLIHSAIPIFFVLIGLEILAAKVLDRPVYSFADSFADLGCGVIEQVTGVFMKGLLFSGYLWLYSNARLTTLPSGEWWVMTVCFVLIDFAYYWFHRMSHEVGALWAAHSVHHQSEEYNLTVALRQGTFQSLFSWVFYLPLALLGFPPALFLTCAALNTLYQFWIHTRLIGKMGPLEWVLNTPSHHRVHHARNPEYIDCNHAGALIIWDRLFGTFVEESHEPVYGVVKPLRSFNPVLANVAPWLELWRVARHARSVLDRVRPLWAAPGWRPQDLGGPLVPPPVKRETSPPFTMSAPRALQIYLIMNFLLIVWIFNRIATNQTSGSGAWVGAAFIALSFAVLSILLRRRDRSSMSLECVRLVALGGLVGYVL